VVRLSKDAHEKLRVIAAHMQVSMTMAITQIIDAASPS
ncbi:hypothetical protein LCGC14_2523570, partial [marine sediment metagenome]